ncbi:MAG: phosphoglucosamine mutase [Bradymonadia bacterium]
MGKRTLFGTDGIRGEANRHPMSAEVALRLGRAIAVRLARGSSHQPRVLIGKDTRRSCYMIEMALASGLCSAGANVMLVGPLPTPGVAFMTAGMRADAGVMISASHNAFQDNGIKIFAGDGFKLPDEVESELEALIEAGVGDLPTGADIGRAYRIDDAHGRYAVFAKLVFPRQYTLDGMKIVVDCAHGAAYRVAPEVLSELGAEVVAMGCGPNGVNINDGVGALYPEQLAERVRAEGAQIGVALDGDADRCILVDEKGNVTDGDQILAILGLQMLADGTLTHNTVVATVMSNLGLNRALEAAGGKLERTQVGDRYVVERMRAEGYVLGGEQSGHIVSLSHTTTGDGLVSALSVLGVMVRSGKPLSELAQALVHYPQVLKSIKVARKPPLDTLPEVMKAIEAVEARYAGEGRVLVRYSGTENKARVMVEGPDEGAITADCDMLCELLATALA